MSTVACDAPPAARRVAWGLGALAAALGLWLASGGTPRTRTADPASADAPVDATADGGAQAQERRAVDAASRSAQADARLDALQAAALEHHLRGRLQHPDPRQRLVAWYLLAWGSEDMALQRRARAVFAQLHAEHPDDPLIARSRTWMCGAPSEPCSDVELDAWLHVEPGNSAAHLDALRRARDDAARQDATLARMAQATGYESHFDAFAREVVVAFDDYVPPPPGPVERRMLREAGLTMDIESRRQLQAASRVWVLSSPALGGLDTACRPPVSTSRARDCRVVAQQMMRATTFIERIVALAVLERLARGTPEGDHWARELRRMRWWSRQTPYVITGSVYWQDFIRHGEVEAMRRALLRAGRPLEPPPGWRRR